MLTHHRIDARLLSCLCGSELNFKELVDWLNLLSCLCGSELFLCISE